MAHLGVSGCSLGRVHGHPVVRHDAPMAHEGRSARERMLAGEDYVGAGDAEIAADLLRAALLVERFNTSSAADPTGRRAILAELLGRLGEDAVVLPPLHCDLGFRTVIGPRTFVNAGLVALDIGAITIGADCQIGPGVQLLTPTHPTDPGPRRAKVEGSRPITLGDNVWLGGGAIVCPGVTIGEDTVVGAGSVVVRDLPAGVVAVGNPARVVRSL
jgi:maltose O-acetyltransferase